MGIIVSLLVHGLAVFITAYLLQAGVKIESFFTAVVVAVVMGFVNTFIKPIISILTLPFNIITLGLFSFVVNGVFILIISNFIPGFTVAGFGWAILFGLVLAIVNGILDRFTG